MRIGVAQGLLDDVVFRQQRGCTSLGWKFITSRGQLWQLCADLSALSAAEAGDPGDSSQAEQE